MTTYRKPSRETPIAYVGLALAVVFLAGAAGLLVTDGGGWSWVRLAVAVTYAGYAVWFFLRARARDRARAAAETQQR